KELEELQKRIDAQFVARQQEEVRNAAPVAVETNAVKKIVADYLHENPGAGMPPSVQTGYSTTTGFVIRSAPNPTYVNWDDDCKIPFELRVRGRIQLAYDNYKVTDRTNHLSNVPATQNANSVRLADFSQIEAKRVQLIFEGTAFDPDLRYRLMLHGDTRGLPGLQNNKVIQTTDTTAPNGSPVATATGGGVTVDHSVRLFEAWVAYDFHGACAQKGCGPDCPEGSFKYAPTYTLIAGKLKPFFGLEEYLGNANEQFVEFSMTDFFFDADDDNRLMAAGLMVKAAEDRFFMQSIITNGSESLFPNSQMDKYPGFITGLWYDLGGAFNRERKAWDLFGDCISDIDYSCKPVARVGGSFNIVPMDRRSLYGDAEQSRYGTMSAGPGGTRLINLLNGDAATSGGSHAVDMFDAYSYNAFIAAKYHGFSVFNEWWVRDLDNFRTTPNGLGNIIYQDTLGPKGAAANALFPHHGLIDYGMNVSAGYFLIPRRLEIAARWAWVRGQSGDINGNGTFTTVTIPGIVGPVHVVHEAFRNFHEANEYTLGINYYFKRQLVKWQTDFGIYDGGNPAVGGTSLAGFIPGEDGFLLRTQFQLMF
ncbi:MAG TPA: hypothetical protein VGY58_00605, partial [Gemmataceae bacterium]|nr:hypothetical protein [Gemmataceae bacterium]